MGTALITLPTVQDALTYALDQLANWQQVPSRVQAATFALQGLAAKAAQAGDAGTIAQLTTDKQALAGIQQQFLDSAALTSTVMRAAQAMQAGTGQPSASDVADAARLAATVASGLSALRQVEEDLVSQGADLTPGAAGGLAPIPAWAKWGLIGLAVWWFLQRVR